MESKTRHYGDYAGYEYVMLGGALIDAVNHQAIPDRDGQNRGERPTEYRFVIPTECSREQTIRREMKRRAAVEPVIGHMKAEHRRSATTSRAVTATAPAPSSPPPATNFSLPLRWFEALLRALIKAVLRSWFAPRTA